MCFSKRSIYIRSKVRETCIVNLSVRLSVNMQNLTYTYYLICRSGFMVLSSQYITIKQCFEISLLSSRCVNIPHAHRVHSTFISLGRYKFTNKRFWAENTCAHHSQNTVCHEPNAECHVYSILDDNDILTLFSHHYNIRRKCLEPWKIHYSIRFNILAETLKRLAQLINKSKSR